jgi:hypothetical protein
MSVLLGPATPPLSEAALVDGVTFRWRPPERVLAGFDPPAGGQNGQSGVVGDVAGFGVLDEREQFPLVVGLDVSICSACHRFPTAV